MVAKRAYPITMTSVAMSIQLTEIPCRTNFRAFLLTMSPITAMTSNGMVTVRPVHGMCSSDSTKSSPKAIPAPSRNDSASQM